MKKVFDQTVRDLKREVNKNVLKVPRIEQKVLDATSNEPWGPHGSALADIAVASRNYHEYQLIMSVIWKRINDTGKNWRHVYKALTVLEYMVAHGSERVIDEIKEHAYQIQTLFDFQYIDSSGRDQGSNVKKKSQSLVALVNDKERISEVRQKAAANKDKYRTASSSGGMYRPGSGGYGDRYEDDRYEGRYRDDDRYGKEKEWNYRDDDRNGKYGDSNSRDGDRYEERYGRDGYKDDNYRGRSHSIDDNQYAQRSRSSDRERDRSVDDDGQYSSRSGTRADDSIDGSKKLDRKFSEQNIGAPPSYEEAVSASQSPVHVEREREAPAAAVPKSSSPPIPAPPAVTRPSQPNAVPEPPSVSPVTQEVQSFDEFDPRSSFSATSVNANNPETDLLGGLELALVPTTETESSSYVTPQPQSNAANQPFGDPFGDSPFKAIPSETTQIQPQTSTSGADAGSIFDFGDPLSGLTYSTASFPSVQTAPSSDFLPPELSTSQQSPDILADILPPGPQPVITSQPGYPSVAPQPGSNPYGNFQPQPGPGALVTVPQNQAGPTGHQGNYLSHAPTVPVTTSHMVPQASTLPNTQFNGGGHYHVPQGQFVAPNGGNFYHHQQQQLQGQGQAPIGLRGQPNSGNFLPQQQPSNDVLGNLGSTVAKPPNDKFETKSKVWNDTLSRGLVNLNISGPKTNPLADIGVDFDALNRKEKRMEKPAATPVTSTVTMGKAMGSGSGIGRAGAGGLRTATPNPMMGSGMGSGMGMGMPGMVGMVNYNNQPMGPPMPGMGGQYGQQPMGMNMGMGMGQGPPMQQPMGYGPGSNVPGNGNGYNPMMGPRGYAPQQPYGGYR